MRRTPYLLRILLAILAVAALASETAAARGRRVVAADGVRIEIQGDGAAAAVVNAQIKRGAVRLVADREIFVPEPKGADDTLDDSAQGGKAEGDAVSTVRGDRVVGEVQTIDADGKLHLTAPHFEGEIVVMASALDKVELLPKEKSDGPDRVALSNGDAIVGDVVAVTPELVVVESKATGPIKISRRIIESITFAQTNPLLLESRFEQGQMRPWQAKGGGWSVSNGALQCFSHGNRQTVFAKFEQTEAVTMEAKVVSTMHRFLHFELFLFADTTDNGYGRNSVGVRLYHSNYYIMHANNGNTNTILNQSMGRTVPQGTIRVAYDPNTSKAHLWLDKRDLGEFAIPNKLTKGKFVMFTSQYPCRVEYIRVMSGVVAPTGDEKAEETASHVVRFANRDRVAAAEIALADGKLSLQTEFGEIAAPLDKVKHIAFRTKGLEKPRRRKGDVRVETSSSRFTLQFGQLTPEFLLGKSSYLGEVKVRRDCLKRIQFNIYK